VSIRLIDGQWLIVDGQLATDENCCCDPSCSGACDEENPCPEGCNCCDGVCQEEPCCGTELWASGSGLYFGCDAEANANAAYSNVLSLLEAAVAAMNANGWSGARIDTRSGPAFFGTIPEEECFDECCDIWVFGDVRLIGCCEEPGEEVIYTLEPNLTSSGDAGLILTDCVGGLP
jgi:hypothetical protein